MIFVTADNHFGHESAALKWRGFGSVTEMDNFMVRCWNATVKPTDQVWHLGDFAWRDPVGYAKRLNGTIHLIRGNHDCGFSNKKLEEAFESVSDARQLKVQVNGKSLKIYLLHYPCRTWPNQAYGGLHLYGHVHGKAAFLEGSYDVGVDSVGYAPLSLSTATSLTQDGPPQMTDAR